MYKLSSGLTVDKSHRARTGYHGSSYSPAWTLDESKPFIGFTTNPTEPHLRSLLRAPDSNSLHLGKFADSREAAYAVAYYKDNMEEVLTHMLHCGQYPFEFPQDLYDLPENVTRSDAVAEIKDQRDQKNADNKEFGFTKKRSKVNGARRFKLNGSAEQAIQKYGPMIFMDLAKNHGAATVINARKNLTLGEFEARFGLAEFA